jgi:hypothetical protein
MPRDQDNDEERESRVESILEKLREDRGTGAGGKKPPSAETLAPPPATSRQRPPGRAGGDSD